LTETYRDKKIRTEWGEKGPKQGDRIKGERLCRKNEVLEFGKEKKNTEERGGRTGVRGREHKR